MRVRRTILIAVTALAALPAVAQAQVQVQINPGLIAKRLATAPPAVVALGDSAISGEAGRWAGNTNQASSKTDALGSGAYNDAGSAEATPGCHRSKSAEVHIGDGIESVNLACSGARTYSRTSDGKFKPGIDFYVSGANKGQARALQESAATHTNIKAVVVLIGANDYGFADILETCVTNWLTSPSWWKNYCQDDSNMVAMFSAANITTITERRASGVPNVKQAMAKPATATSQYEILAQTYSAPLPMSSGFRYPETGFTRQTIGGCGVWNSDANWARNTVVNTLNNTSRTPSPGWRTCRCWTWSTRSTAASCARTPSACSRRRASRPGRAPGAVDKTEWVHQIRTLTTIFPPYQLQEDGHPNYWGQLALRNCFRQAYNGGAPAGGHCARGTGLNAQGRAEHGRARRLRRCARRIVVLAALLAAGLVRAGAGRHAARRLADAAPLRRRVVRRARAAAGPGAAARAADRDRLPLVPGRAPGGRAAARGRRGRAGLPVDRQRGEYRGIFGPLLRQRDLLLVDNRGTGASALIDCKSVQSFAGRTSGSAFARRAARCAREIDARYGRGASGLFATAYAADDLAAVHPRAAAGQGRPLRRLLRHATSCRTSSRATRGCCTR